MVNAGQGQNIFTATAQAGLLDESRKKKSIPESHTGIGGRGHQAWPVRIRTAKTVKLLTNPQKGRV